jgi:hypothetical protein
MICTYDTNNISATLSNGHARITLDTVTHLQQDEYEE